MVKQSKLIFYLLGKIKIVKILLYSINYAPELTGIGKYTSEMGKWLLENNHQIRVITAQPYYPQWKVFDGYSAWSYKKEQLDGIIITRCPLWIPNKPTGLKRILHLLSFALTSIPVMLANVLWRPKLIIVIQPPLFISPLAIITAKLSGSKVLHHIQDFEVDAAFDLGLIKFCSIKKIVKFFEKKLLNNFDRVSTISNRMVEKLIEKGVSKDKIVFFPNWVDTSVIYPLSHLSVFRDEIGIANDSVIFLYSGNLGFKQGIDIIIDAAKILLPDNRIHFVISGSGSAYESLREQGKNLENITWLPLQPVNRLNELLNLADIHLLPQKADVADLVMPSKLTGMLASGRAVIATADENTEISKVLRKCGLVTPPEDIESFVVAIKKLVDDPEMREKFGRNARDYAVGNLDYSKILQNFEGELVKFCG